MVNSLQSWSSGHLSVGLEISASVSSDFMALYKCCYYYYHVN